MLQVLMTNLRPIRAQRKERSKERTRPLTRPSPIFRLPYSSPTTLSTGRESTMPCASLCRPQLSQIACIIASLLSAFARIITASFSSCKFHTKYHSLSKDALLSAKTQESSTSPYPSILSSQNAHNPLRQFNSNLQLQNNVMNTHLQTRVHFPLITSLILSSLEITPSDSISCNPNNAHHFSYPTSPNPKQAPHLP